MSRPYRLELTVVVVGRAEDEQAAWNVEGPRVGGAITAELSTLAGVDVERVEITSAELVERRRTERRSGQ